MKLLRYQYRGEVRVGILGGEHVVDLGDVVRQAGYLTPGDVVSCEIERIGVLRNKVVLPS